ncbi:T9SS type A sorting domain-containing protein [candidate division KSB1 bacterium]|nr:T9SS type A sorting domain-containing protein [candidate division KSB1 bacterium]
MHMVKRLILMTVFFPFMLWAQFNGEIGLQSAPVKFVGENDNDEAGYHISVVGDVNSDGYEDILIAAPDNSQADNRNGKVYLIFGRPGSWQSPINLAEADASFLGEEITDRASHDVFGIGDVNNDGIDDIGIGVKFYDQTGNNAGKVYIIFGKETGWQKDISLGDAADATYLGVGATSEAGHVMGTGDINGDHIDDFIIGAGFSDEFAPDAGKVYVFFGKETGWEMDVSMDSADASYYGEEEGDMAGHRVAGVGDIDGDGLNDFIVASHGADRDSIMNRGEVHLFYGKTTGWQVNGSLADADASFIGPEQRNRGIGANLMGGGDVNGDGLQDMIIAGENRSIVFVVLGQTTPYVPNMNIEEVAVAKYLGEKPSDHAGYDLRSVGDINMDGYDDFLVGAYYADTGRGKAYLILGRQDWTQNQPFERSLADADAIFIGEGADDRAGFSVSGGNINGDEYPDLLISAPENDSNGEKSGSVYLFFGGKSDLAVTAPKPGDIIPTDIQYTITWTSADMSGNVQIELSRDNGATWEIINAQTPDDGAAFWDVEGPATTEALIRITHLDNGQVANMARPFTIVGPSLTLVQPNGGEAWAIGETYVLRWQSTGLVEKVNLELSRDNGDTWMTIASEIENTGEYDMQVTEPESDSCLIRITDSTVPEITDTSDDRFAIRSPGLTLLVPNGGEKWSPGQEQDILWQSSGAIPQVDIEITYDDGTTWSAIAQQVTNNGQYSWTVPETLSDSCWIRISDSANPDVQDVSDNRFAIVQSSITLLIPNGEQVWTIEDLALITWESQNNSLPVNIDLSRDGGATWESLFESMPDSGQVYWTVSGPTSESCLVRVQTNDGQVMDMSDAFFSIAQAGSLTLMQPNGNETWLIHSWEQVSWSTENGSGAVRIDLSRDQGATWETLSDSIPDLGQFTWQVTPEPSQTCLLAVTDLGTGFSDTSNAVFSIDFETTVNRQESGIPSEFALLENYPNPFNPETQISFHLPKSSFIDLAVYNAIGQKIRTLSYGEQPAGRYQVMWDGRDDQGISQPSGIYFYQIKTSEWNATRRMLMIK